MNKIYFACLIVFLNAIATDATLQSSWIVPANVQYEINPNKVRNCFICKKPNPDVFFLNRFKQDMHKSCYDAIAEIEPIYAGSIITSLCRKNCYYIADFREYVLKRKELIRKVYKYIQAQNFDSFDAFTAKRGNNELKIVFWSTYVSFMKEHPTVYLKEGIIEQKHWNIPLKSAIWIPEGNENTLL